MENKDNQPPVDANAAAVAAPNAVPFDQDLIAALVACREPFDVNPTFPLQSNTALCLTGRHLTDNQVKVAIEQANGRLCVVAITNAPQLTVAAFEPLSQNKRLAYLDVSGCSGLFPLERADRPLDVDEASFRRCFPQTTNRFVLKLAGCFQLPQTRPSPNTFAVTYLAPNLLGYKLYAKRIDMGTCLCSGPYCEWKKAEAVPCDYDASGGDIAVLCDNKECSQQCIACKCRYSKDYAYKGMGCRSCSAFWCSSCISDPRLVLLGESQDTTEQQGGIFDCEYMQANDRLLETRGQDLSIDLFVGNLRCRYCSLLATMTEDQKESAIETVKNAGISYGVPNQHQEEEEFDQEEEEFDY